MPAIRPGTILFVPSEAEGVAASSRTVYLMGEVQKPGAYELGADAGLVGLLEQPLLQLAVAEGLPVLVALGGQLVQVAGGGQLDGLEVGLGRRDPLDQTRRKPTANRKYSLFRLRVEARAEVNACRTKSGRR